MASLKASLWRLVGFFYRRTVDRSVRCSPAERPVERLTALGYDAVNLGGYRDWLAAGLPTRLPAT